jgi:hypothetical protein
MKSVLNGVVDVETGTNPLKTKKVKVLLYSMLSDFRKSIAFGKVPRLSPFTILLRAMCR